MQVTDASTCTYMCVCTHTHTHTHTNTHTHTRMYAHTTDGMRAVQNLEPHRLYRPLGMLCTCILSLPEMCRMHLSSTCVCLQLALHMLRVRCVCVRARCCKKCVVRMQHERGTKDASRGDTDSSHAHTHTHRTRHMCRHPQVLDRCMRHISGNDSMHVQSIPSGL